MVGRRSDCGRALFETLLKSRNLMKKVLPALRALVARGDVRSVLAMPGVAAISAIAFVSALRSR